MTYKDHFEQTIREKASHMRASPSDQAWNRVKQNLHDGQQKGRSVHVYRYMAMAASLLLLVSIGVLFYRSKSPLQNKTVYEITPLPIYITDANLSIWEINHIYQELSELKGPAAMPQINKLN